MSAGAGSDSAHSQAGGDTGAEVIARRDAVRRILAGAMII